MVQKSTKMSGAQWNLFSQIRTISTAKKLLLKKEVKQSMKVGNYLKHLNKYCVNFAENTYTISDIIFLPFTLFSSEGNSLQVKRNLKSSVTNFLSSLPSKNKCLAIAVETYVKAGIKVFWSCPVLLDFITFGKVFCHWMSDKPNLCS